MKTPNLLKIKRNSGFTLVELLVVITIIVILTGLTMGAMGYVNKKAALDKARTQMALLENALQQYHADHGEYPEGNGRRGSSLAIYKALFGDGVGPDGVVGTEDDTRVDGRPDDGAKVYLPDLDPDTNPQQMVGGSGRSVSGLIDPFGGDWYFMAGERYEPRMNNPDFDLFSYGPDGRSGARGSRLAADDIRNY